MLRRLLMFMLFAAMPLFGCAGDAEDGIPFDPNQVPNLEGGETGSEGEPPMDNPNEGGGIDPGLGDVVSAPDAGTDPDGFVSPPPLDCNTDPECDDGNVCTVDRCMYNVCEYQPTSGLCDDGNPCTEQDACNNGGCFGLEMTCDDQNGCTEDSCGAQGCEHAPVDTPACELSVTITSPGRGVMLTGSATKTITGKVESPAAEVTLLTLNGAALSVGADGSFSATYKAAHGLNVLTAIAENAAEQKAKAVQSFAFSKVIHPPGSPAAITLLESGYGFWADEQVFDDDDTSDLDDLATLGWMVLDGYDIVEALPDPLFPPGQEPTYSFIGYTCTWDVTLGPTEGNPAGDIDYTITDLDINPQTGEVLFSGTLENFSAWVEAVAPGLCPDALGVISATSVDMEGSLTINATPSGSAEVIVNSVEIYFYGFDVDIQQGAAAWVDFIINWYEDNISEILKEQLEDWISTQFAPMINGVLEQVTHYDLSFEIPPLTNNAALPLHLKVRLEDTHFYPQGALFEMSMGLAANKNTEHDAPGFIGRTQCLASGVIGGLDTLAADDNSCVNSCGEQAPDGCWCDEGCLGYQDCCADACAVCGVCAEGEEGGGSSGVDVGEEVDAELPINDLVEVYAKEDLANQALFHLWWGGYTKMSVYTDDFAGLIATMGITNLTVDMDPLLPPMITTCTDNGNPEVQFGDVYINANFDFLGAPADVEVYGSVRVEIELEIVEVPGGQNTINAKVVDIKQIASHIVETHGLGNQGEALVEAILSDVVVDLLAGKLVQNLTTSYPVPAIYPGTWIPGLSLNKKITFNPELINWVEGYLIFGGHVLEL